MDLETLAIVALLQAISLVSIAILRHKLMDLMAEAFEKRLITWFSDADNQKSLAANAQNMVVAPLLAGLQHAVFGQKGGIAKGINAQLKGLEGDLISAGIDQAVGFPIGDLALQYLDQYPILKQLIPVMLKGGLQVKPSSEHSLP